MFLCKEWIEINNAEIYEGAILEVRDWFNSNRQKNMLNSYSQIFFETFE